MLVYRSTGLGLVPSLNGAVLGYSDQQAALIYDRDDCRVLILSMPKPEVERAELLKLLKDRPDICVAGEKGDDRKTTGNIVAVTLTAACAPLEQAPLVYSSSHQIGVGLSSGTPNAPGLDVTLGYKGIDAAYVPVAVAKPCPAQTRCPTPDVRQIQIVTGRNDVLDDQSVSRDQIDTIEKRVTELTTATKERAGKIEQLKSALRKQQDRTAEASRTNDAQGAALSAEAILARDARVKELDVQIAGLVPVARIDLAVALAAAEKDQSGDEVELAKQLQNLSNLRAVRRSQSRDAKIDALSVYGSFDGQAGGNKDGASLSLGKVFSTGVAAQNLTQGLGNSSVIAQRVLCIDKLTKAAAAMKQDGDKLLARVEEICTRKLTDKP